MGKKCTDCKYYEKDLNGKDSCKKKKLSLDATLCREFERKGRPGGGGGIKR